MTIWKFPLPVPDEHGNLTVEMPRCATLLCVQLQQGVPTLWAVVDPTRKVEVRSFRVVGTGWELGESHNLHRLLYVGTWQDAGLVWHLFDSIS